MRILHDRVNLSAFFDALSGPGANLLLLDYDGTLAPFKLNPDEAVPYPEVPEILGSIISSGQTRLVVVSGRPVDSLKPLIGLDPLPEIWGSHGWERFLPDGSYQLADIGREARRGIEQAAQQAEARGVAERLERKPSSLAVHVRGMAPDQADRVLKDVSADWSEVAERSGLDIKEFDGGVEIRVPGRDKGDAVRTLLSESGGEAVAAYLGDDFTDEDAFKALRGRGLSVLVRPEFRPTAADLWLVPPGELLDFLRSWLTSTGGGNH